MLRWLCNSNLNNECLHGGPDSVWPYLTYREISEYSSPSALLTIGQSWGESKQKIKKLSRHPILIDLYPFCMPVWQQHHIIWLVDTIRFLEFHKILLAPLLLRYSLLVTFCVKIYEIITREPILWRGREGVLAPMFPDHREHLVQTQWAGGAWYYYGIIMTLTHYKVNTSSVQQQQGGCQAA